MSSGGHNRKNYKHSELSKAKNSLARRKISFANLSDAGILAAYQEYRGAWPRKCLVVGCTAMVKIRNHFVCRKCGSKRGLDNPAKRPEVRAKISRNLKVVLAGRSVEQKALHLRNVLKSVCQRPNTFEFNALNYLNTRHNNSFVYTGNGSFIVNGRSADAYSKDLNTVALFHGNYWHLKKFGLEITEDNKRAAEKVDSLPFLSAGYRVLFIWEDELDKVVAYST